MKKTLIEKQSVIVFLLVTVVIIALFLTAVSNIDSEKTAEDKAQLERAIINAAISCYAIEGAYPPSVEYLVENYNIQIDSKRFTVKYELYASNLMPEITVLINDHEN